MLTANLAALDSADLFDALRDVSQQGTYYFSDQGFSLFHMLIGAAALAALSK